MNLNGDNETDEKNDIEDVQNKEYVYNPQILDLSQFKSRMQIRKPDKIQEPLFFLKQPKKENDDLLLTPYLIIINQKKFKKNDLNIKAYKKKKTILRQLTEVYSGEIKVTNPSNSQIIKRPSLLPQLIRSTTRLFNKPVNIENSICVSISSCGSKIVCSQREGVLIFIDLDITKNTTFANEKVIAIKDCKRISHLCWSKDGQYYALVQNEQLVQVRFIEDHHLLVQQNHQKKVIQIKFYGQDGVLVWIYETGDIIFTNIFTNEVIMQFPTEPNVSDMNFSENGEYLVIGFQDGNFIVYKYIEKFNNFFSGNVETTPYINMKDINQKLPKERKRKQFQFFKNKNKNQIMQILFYTEHRIFLLTRSCEIILLNMKKQVIEQKYKVQQSFSMIPISINFQESYLMLLVNNGTCFFWNLINKYVPMFNPKIIAYNPLINFSFEKIEILKNVNKEIRHNSFSQFLSLNQIAKWRDFRDVKAEYILLVLGSNGEISLYEKSFQKIPLLQLIIFSYEINRIDKFQVETPRSLINKTLFVWSHE